MTDNSRRKYKFDEICPYVREVGLQRGDSWKNRQRKIYDHQYMYCFSGIAHVSIGGSAYQMIPGSLVLIRPNTPHSFWVDEKMPGELYYVHFDYFYREDADKIIDFYDKVDNYVNLFGNIPLMGQHVRRDPQFDNGYEFPEYLKIKDTNRVEMILRSMHKSYIQKDSSFGISTRIYLLELLEAILNQTTIAENYSSANHRVLVEQMKDYIARNYYRKLRPSEVALTTNLCVDHASRIFKKITGMKLVEYIAKYRISKAKELMLEPDLTIEQIAFMVGFENQNYFSRTVKKYEGEPPATLRADLRSELGIH
ncbi:AraC family transcriptional regulator [Vallitalea okinawensis]|uniref:AraC family transcriptional regulator n=1 Tax=Vallitalea okinawensis TaxID=2078660 RepID=UPI000CFDF3CD|nr:AraC family transcriptional regulator [Vallitalea okinawensis]